MRSKIAVPALILALCAPVLVSGIFVQETLAAEAPARGTRPIQLPPELETELQAALIGTPEEVEVQLQALLDANPDTAQVISARARQVAPAAVASVVNTVTQVFVATVAAPSPGRNDPNAQANATDALNTTNSSQGGIFTVSVGNQNFALPAASEDDVLLSYAFGFQQGNSFPSSTRVLIQALVDRLGNSGFTSCVAGVGVHIGPYGTATTTLSGC